MSRLARVAGVAVLSFSLWLGAALPAPAADDAAAQATVHEKGGFRFAVGPAPAFVQVHDVASAWTAGVGVEAGDPWRSWLLDRQIDRRDGGYRSYEDRAYEPRSSSLLGEAGKFSIAFSPEYQQLTIHRVELRRDGRWQDRLDPARIDLVRRETGFERDLADGQVSALVVMDDVRVGDVIRIAYTIDGFNPIMGGHVGSRLVGALGAPMLERRGRVLFDPAADVASVQLGMQVDVRHERHADRQEFAFVRTSVPAVVDTEDYPNWYSPYPELQLAERRSWAEIVEWARPLYPDQAELPAELETRLAQWRKLETHAAIGAVLRTVQDEVRYFGIEMGDNTHRPNPPALVWSRRYGDCKDKAYLTALLLRRLGIDAVPALVSMSDGAALKDFLPAASVFDHVIVRARVGKETLWLDPTITQQRGDVRQLDLAPYGVALPVAAGSDRLETVVPPDRVDNRVAVVETFTPVEGEGDPVDLVVESRFTGEHAESLRRRLQEEREELAADGYADYYRRRYGPLQVAAKTTIEDDTEANEVRIVERYRLEAPWVDGRGRVIDTWPEALSDGIVLPSSMARTAPLRLQPPGVLRHEVRVKMPAGWSSVTRGGVVESSGGPISYRRAISEEGRTVAVVHELKIERDHVTSEQMDAYLEGVREAKSASGVRLSFNLPTALRDSERDRRLQALLRGTLDPESDDAE